MAMLKAEFRKSKALAANAAEGALEAVGAGMAVRNAAALSCRAFKGLVTSERFVKAVNKTFDEVDVDNSGTIEKAELFIAILLLINQVNKMPMVGRQEPPSRAEVERVMNEHTSSGALDRDQFLRVCQDLLEDTLKGMGFRFIAITVLSPIIAMAFRRGLDRTLCTAVPLIGKLMAYIPDSLFIPFAASIMSGFTPILIEMLQPEKQQGARAAGADGVNSARGAKEDAGASSGKSTSIFWSLFALLCALMVPVVLRVVWEVAGGGDVYALGRKSQADLQEVIWRLRALWMKLALYVARSSVVEDVVTGGK